MGLLQIDYFERLVASQTPKKVADVGELFRDNKLAFGPKEHRPQNSYESTLEYPRFSDGAATNRHFREVCSSQHPQKISKGVEATFFGRIFFGFMQIRSLSSEVDGRTEPRCGGGGPPPRFC